MTMRAVREANIPAILAALHPKMHRQIMEDRPALGAVPRLKGSDALSVEKGLQSFDKFTVPLRTVGVAHVVSFETRSGLRRGL
jgi:hypothetical protein